MTANRPLTDDELLAPSLTAHDDASGFDRPWHPTYLVLVGAFFGLIPMGLLMAENFRRLGRPRAFAPTLAFGLACGIALTALTAYAHVFGIPGLYDAGSPEHRRALRLAHQVFAIAAGLVLANKQNPRWHIHSGHGGESAPLLKHALGAIAVGLLIQALVAAPFAMMSHGAPAR